MAALAVDAKARVAQLTGFRSITAAAEFPAAFGCFFSWLKARLCGGGAQVRLGWTAGTERVWFFVGAGLRPARGRGKPLPYGF